MMILILIIALLSVSCDRPVQKKSRAEFLIDLQDIYNQGVRTKAFPANQKVCFAVEINGPAQPPSPAGGCYPALGLFKGFVESNQSIELEVNKGNNYSLRIFAEIKNIGDSSACSNWVPSAMDYTKIYQVAELTGLNLEQDTQAIPISTVFPGSSQNIKTTLNLSDCAGVNVCTGTDFFGGDIEVLNGQTLAGTYCNVGNFNIASGVTAYVGNQQKLVIHASAVNIAGTLSADQKGYPALQGPSAATGTLGGGGHVGQGGGSTGGLGLVSPLSPTEMGSGGGAASGGGYIEINATSSLSVTGMISANGEASSSGGAGSGGTIRLKAPTVSGNGIISANGGNSQMTTGGGGAGGIVFIQSDTITPTVSINSGAGDSYGTNFSIYHGAPAVFVHSDYAAGVVLSARLNAYGYPNRIFDMTPLAQAETLYVAGQASIEINSVFNPSIGIEGGMVKLTGSAQVGSVDMTSGVLKVQGNATISSLTASAGSVYSPVSTVTWGDITITGGAKFTAESVRTPATPSPIVIKATNLTLQSGGSIDASSAGYSATAGPGGTATAYQGGTYGGSGGGNAAATYGSNTNPDDFGSGGFGSAGNHNDYWYQGSGGGKIRLQITNSLVVNGPIKSDGVSGFCCINIGAGSGGSIFIKAGQISGSSNISANGGSHPGTASGSGGGGGRVALYYNTKTHSGAVTANGGSGYSSPNGAAGSVYDGGTNSYNTAPAL